MSASRARREVASGPQRASCARRGSVLAGVTSLLLAAGCSAATTTTGPAKPRPSVDARPTFDSPARWARHPETPGVPTAVLELDGGRCLVTTDLGERWLVEPDRSSAEGPRCAGRARASGHGALDAIVAVQRAGELLRFVGEGGLLYEAEEPLGPFVRASRPPRHLSRVAAGKQALIGLDEAGEAWFYDGSWRASAVPRGAAGYDVAIGRDDRALWLGLPERVLGSTDGGKSFAALGGAAPPLLGARELGTTMRGEVAVGGLLGTLVWRGASLTPSSEPVVVSAVVDAELEPEPGPRASAVRDRRAVLAGRRYVELRQSDEAPDGGWVLREGELGGALRDRPLRGLSCESAIVGAAGSVTVVACMHEEPESGRLSVELFELGAGEPQSFAKLRAETFLDVELAVSSRAEVLLTGVCGADDERAAPPSDEAAPSTSSRARRRKAARAEGACDGSAPTWVRREGAGSVIVRGRANESVAAARSPTVSADGRSLYFLGRYGPEQLAAVFVSRDGGRSYLARALAAPYPTRSELDEDWQEGAMESVRQLDLEPIDEAQLTIDESGVLGLPVSDGMGMAWASIAPDGRVAEVHRPPLSSGVLAGHGARVFIAGYDDREGLLQAFESADGGASFTEIPPSPSLAAAIDAGVGFVCGAAGCLLGDELARVGWDGQLEAALSLPEDIPPVYAPRLGEVIGCEPTNAKPTRFAGLGDDRAEAPRLPRLDELARGELAWSSVAVDPVTGEIELVTAAQPASGAAAAPPTRKPLLPGRAQARGEPPPYVVRPQAEGYVALRATNVEQASATAARGRPAPRGPQSYELAWTNQLSGRGGRQRVQLDRTAPQRASSLAPSMLQIAMDGVALRATETSPLSFVDARGVTPVDYPPFDRLLDLRGSTFSPELAVLAGQPWGLAVSRSPSEPTVVALAKAGGASAKAIALGRPSSELGWLHAPGRIGVAVQTPAARDGDDARAFGVWVEPDGSFGAPFDLPSLSAALEAQRPCTAEETRTAPRLVAPHFTQSGVMLAQRGRQAVVVLDGSPSEPLARESWLLSDGAVLHVGASGPCVAALSAASLRPGALVVLGGDGRSGWLLEHAPDDAPPATKPRPGSAPAPAPGQVLRVRALSCRPRADLPVPPEVQARAGDPLLRGRR